MISTTLDYNKHDSYQHDYDNDCYNHDGVPSSVKYILECEY